MNCSHKVKGLRICAGDGRVTFFHTLKLMGRIEIHTDAHLRTHFQAVHTKQINGHIWCIHTCSHTQPAAHTLTGTPYFTSLRWLVEAFIKKKAVSQQFMANSVQLQGSVFLLQL